MRLAHLFVVVVAMSCSAPARFVVPGVVDARADLSVVDSRLPDEAGRFEAVIETPIERVVTWSLSSWYRTLDVARYRADVRILDLGWRWSSGPFFVATVSGIARLLVEVFERESGVLLASEVVSSVKTEETATGDSLRIAADRVLVALEAVAAQLDARPSLAFAKKRDR